MKLCSTTPTSVTKYCQVEVTMTQKTVLNESQKDFIKSF